MTAIKKMSSRIRYAAPGLELSTHKKRLNTSARAPQNVFVIAF